MAQPIDIANFNLDTYFYICLLIDSIPSRPPSNQKPSSQIPDSLLLIPTDLHIKAPSHLHRVWILE